jgi:vacuolar-type H+-ATPase subunit E/Vma4
MAESMDSLTSKYDDISIKVDGVEGVLQQILDKLSGIESSQSKSDASLISLARKYDDAAVRLQRLEAQPPPQPPPQLPPRPP